MGQIPKDDSITRLVHGLVLRIPAPPAAHDVPTSKTNPYSRTALSLTVRFAPFTPSGPAAALAPITFYRPEPENTTRFVSYPSTNPRGPDGESRFPDDNCAEPRPRGQRPGEEATQSCSLGRSGAFINYDSALPPGGEAIITQRCMTVSGRTKECWEQRTA